MQHPGPLDGIRVLDFTHIDLFFTERLWQGRATPGGLRLPPPAYGQHTTEVLMEHGFSKEEIESLKKAGALYGD